LLLQPPKSDANKNTAKLFEEDQYLAMTIVHAIGLFVSGKGAEMRVVGASSVPPQQLCHLNQILLEGSNLRNYILKER
jgi:hypothetical protein